jgi:hypothetical protein
MARAGSMPYYVAYINEYGDPEMVRVKNFDEEREFGRVFARSYNAGIVRRAVRAKEKALAREHPNPDRRVRRSTGWIKAKAVRIEKRGRQYVVKVKR